MKNSASIIIVAISVTACICISSYAQSTDSADREKLTEELIKQYPKHESKYVSQCKSSVTSLARTYEKKISNTETFCACQAKMMYLENALAVRDSLIGKTPTLEDLRKLHADTSEKVNRRAMKECPTE
jgi:lipoate-protein ligase A